jgi:S1-C subfamily serine protease
MRLAVTRALAVAAAVACTVGAVTTERSEAAGSSRSVVALEPKQLSELATGAVLIRTFDCTGSAMTTGSGFLVGASIVMTARHVAIQPTAYACKIKVRAQGRWISVVSRHRWAPGGGNGRASDLATLKLSKPVSGVHIFSIATSPARIGTILAMIGHPLGNDVSVTQGRVLSRLRFKRVPYLAVNLLGAGGASGSAIVNTHGNVVAVLQRGSGAEDALGEYTGGLIFGIDLPKVWGPAERRALCRVYPAGGIPGCDAPPVPG